MQHLLLDPQVRVIHAYLERIEDVHSSERDSLLTRVRPYLKGGHEPAPGDHVSYFAYEYKDDTGRTLLVIEKSC